MQIKIEDKIITFEVQFSKRKSLYLDISNKGYMTLKAPAKTSESDILAFMRENKDQLLKVQSQLENRQYISSQKNYHEEELFLYLGKAYKLSQILNPLPQNEAQALQQLQRFYLSETKRIVKKRVKHFEKIIGVSAKSVTIVDSPKTWGTCNSKRELTFNYKLCMAPEPVIDYVIIHELCHILHLNHDRSFWRKVGTYDPNYKQNQAYLGRFGAVMTI